LRATISATRRRFVVAVAVSASLVIASCGGDDDDAADTTAAAAEETTAAPTPTEPAATTAPPATEAPETTAPPETEPAAPAGSPLVVAALADATGPSAGSQASTEAQLNAWADFVNGNGGLNGHPVEIEVRDTKGDAATTQAAVDELVALDPVVIFLASASTETAVAESLTASGVPVVGVGYSPSVWGGNIESFKLACSTDPGAPVPCALPNAFTVTTTFGAVVDEQVLGAQAAGATKLAVAACAEVDSCSAAEPVFAATAAALGLEYSGLVKISSTAPDYTAECIQFVQDGVDFIQISASGEAGAKLYSDCSDQGYDGLFGASAGTVSGALIKTEGISLAGGLNAFPWWVDDPAVVEFRDAMEAAGISPDDYGNPNATGLWSVMQLFAKALSNTDITADDEVTKDDALAAMYTLKDETLDGLISPITFTEGQLASHRPCFWPFVLKDGEFTNPLGGLAYQCYPAES
jgi:branched-chain amino acid transport system substrate-binding protein